MAEDDKPGLIPEILPPEKPNVPNKDTGAEVHARIAEILNGITPDANEHVILNRGKNQPHPAASGAEEPASLALVKVPSPPLGGAGDHTAAARDASAPSRVGRTSGPFLLDGSSKPPGGHSPSAFPENLEPPRLPDGEALSGPAGSTVGGLKLVPISAGNSKDQRSGGGGGTPPNSPKATTTSGADDDTHNEPTSRALARREEIIIEDPKRKKKNQQAEQDETRRPAETDLHFTPEEIYHIKRHMPFRDDRADNHTKDFFHTATASGNSMVFTKSGLWMHGNIEDYGHQEKVAFMVNARDIHGRRMTIVGGSRGYQMEMAAYAKVLGIQAETELNMTKRQQQWIAERAAQLSAHTHDPGCWKEQARQAAEEQAWRNSGQPSNAGSQGGPDDPAPPAPGGLKKPGSNYSPKIA